MIVVSDTMPLISLMKIGQLGLLEKYFGEVQIPEAVFRELTSNVRFANEADQIKGCSFIHIVKINDYRSVNLLRRATGLLMASYQSGNITADEIKKCIRILRDSGRHIGEKYLQMLLEQIR